jgi:hypothetical protein
VARERGEVAGDKGPQSWETCADNAGAELSHGPSRSFHVVPGDILGYTEELDPDD